ncbi:MAG: apolipoprotein N-acyltransferase [Pirellulaceae bacterium]
MALALAGGLVLFVAFPPLGLWPLVWVAPVFWLVLVQLPELPGRRPLRAIWLAGALHWLLMLQGIRMAHWANHLGWIALSFYLAAYLPCFVSLTRVAVHQLRISLMLAAPMVWTGLELARGYLFTGFSVGLLGHALSDQTMLIQVSDLFGAYGVSFFVMLVAACVTRVWQIGKSSRAVVPALTLVVVSLAVLLYGRVRMGSLPRSVEGETLKVALIQHSVDKVFKPDRQRNLRTFQLYRDLTLQARDQHPDLDLVIWPESVLTENMPEYMCHGQFIPPAHIPLDPEQARKQFQQIVAYFQDKVRGTADSLNRIWVDGEFRQLEIYLLAGSTAIDIGDGDHKEYNSVLLIHPEGRILDRYYKMHPVMFGEYLPFGDHLPWLYGLTPMRGGLTRGDRPSAFEVKGIRLSPSICFESTVPHLIRRHVRQLGSAQRTPDILVNVTDDGWFWGTSVLDLQLACAVFRAVELRRPFLVAANTGISAWIDGNGSVRERGPRRDKRIIVARVGSDERWSLYLAWGDLPAATCLAACLLLALFGWVRGRRRAKKGERSEHVGRLTRG